MIRINLLGSPKPKGGKKGLAVSMPSMDMGRAGSPVLQVVAVLAIVGAVNGVYWYRLDHEKTAIAAQMQVAEQKNRELADIKARYIERQKQADAYKRRVDVIDQLRSNQTGPVNLLAMIGETVNHTEAIWLSSLQDQGNSVAIDGMALSSDAVANLISNLQKTGYFRNIEIKETMQDESVKDMQAFQFTLTCEKANDKAKS
ncbi:MAG TPA: PilN domain-containing protein [Terriglobales bacterium]